MTIQGANVENMKLRNAKQILHNMTQWALILGPYKMAHEEMPITIKALENYDVEEKVKDGMKFVCPVCKNEVKEDDNFCSKCGKHIGEGA